MNLRNGNNTNFQQFSATNNPNLFCVEVDDVIWAEANWDDQTPFPNIDSQVSFSTDCSNTCSLGLQEVSDNNKQVVRVIDLMGREIEPQVNRQMIYIYSDGSSKKVFRVE